MPQIIDTIRFLEWGKPAPANSEFKGVISTEKIFGNGNEGSYFGYTSRSTATESSGNEKLTMTEDGFLGYTSRDYASGGSTFSSMGWLDQDKAEEFKAEGRKAFSEKGDLIWDAVIALEDFEAAHKNGLFHTADYADAMSKVLPRFFKTVGLDPVNMMWWMNYHNNTDHPHNEYFAAVYLNTKNKPLDFMIVNIAGTDYSRMDPATVIKGALLQNATKVMLFHNHPSGELTPSQADLISTQKMVIAAKLNGIEVLDHVIVGEDGFHSFAESGQMDLLSSEYLDGLKELRELSAEEFNTRYSFEARELDLNNELSI